MAGSQREVSDAKLKAALLFVALLVALCALAGMGSAHPAKPVALLGEDMSFIWRAVIAILGCGLSYMAGRQVFKFLLNAWVPVAEAINGGLMFVFFLALLVILLAGSGELYWPLAILLVVLLVAFSVPVLWRLIGGGLFALMLLAGLAAFVAGHFLV
jgi:hypothetical protein